MSKLQNQLAAILSDQLGDEALGRSMAAHLLEVGANWVPPTIPMAKVDSLVAYAFGNRPRHGPPPPTDAALLDRLDEPGPVNAALAETIATLYALQPARIFAQWEVAHFLETRHGLTGLISIEPVLDAAGEVIYLSTDGVAAAALAAGGGDLGTVAVIATTPSAASRSPAPPAWTPMWPPTSPCPSTKILNLASPGPGRGKSICCTTWRPRSWG